jgi:hypothetical protein
MVREPCNLHERFPVTVQLEHYPARERLLEACWKSDQTPGRGLSIGESRATPRRHR